jgi:hypothetical protein
MGVFMDWCGTGAARAGRHFHTSSARMSAPALK